MIVIIQPTKNSDGTISAYDIKTGVDYTGELRPVQIQLAYDNSQFIKFDTDTGRQRRIHPDKASDIDPNGSMAPRSKSTVKKDIEHGVDSVVLPENENDVISFLKDAGSTVPSNIIISPVKWRYMLRSILRGKNIMITGETGTGKTTMAKIAAEATDRPCHYFNLGSTQDPRSTLIGNTQFSKDDGTFFSDSAFVKAIQIPNSVVLLDELSRAHPEAWNILMSVLDDGQRYLRIDEAIDSPVIRVAEGVSFIATANIGAKYTATRIMDRALSDRFVILEMDQLTEPDELRLVLSRTSIDKKQAKELVEIAGITRKEAKSDSGKLSNSISTRLVLEAAGLIEDGFDLHEAAEVCIYPFFDDGGMDSERTFVKQTVQKYITD